MSHCPINHTLEDIKKKLIEQQPFLPEELYPKVEQYLNGKLDQQTLNEVFHLLKKYDLATDEVKVDRNTAFQKLFTR